jgi:hypothetical protein
MAARACARERVLDRLDRIINLGGVLARSLGLIPLGMQIGELGG